MAKPVRLQLSRRKGFNLQELSMATNGLPAVNVARPSKFGNQYDWTSRAALYGESKRSAKRWAYRAHRADWRSLRKHFAPLLEQLRSKNVACWCGPDEWCHGDTLLELANAQQEDGK